MEDRALLRTAHVCVHLDTGAPPANGVSYFIFSSLLGAHYITPAAPSEFLLSWSFTLYSKNEDLRLSAGSQVTHDIRSFRFWFIPR